MRLHRATAVAVSAVILAAAGTVAVNAAGGGDTITLCVQKDDAAVRQLYAAGSSGCQKGFKSVPMPSSAALDALNGRLTAAEQQIDALWHAVDHGTLRVTGALVLGAISFDVVGDHLKPGAAVTLTLNGGAPIPLGAVENDGTFQDNEVVDCPGLPIEASSTTEADRPISAQLSTVPGC